MGLLDEAIREHLDLKRRRGADPAEVERAEREALGPVRRNRDPAAAADPDASGDVGSAWDEPDDGVAVDLAEESRSGADEPSVDADVESSSAVDFVAEDDEPFAEQPTGEQRPAGEQPPASEVALEDATVEHRLDEPPGERGTDEDEDVLEETPEFLQDTPDHDRLWFEQRPPRDFDFDG